MITPTHRAHIVILASQVIAFVLTVIPLPTTLALLRPEWVALTLLYWCMALPNRVGVGIAWTTGIFLDVLRGGLLGQDALTLSIIAYIVLKFYRRIRVAPLWQQAVTIFGLMLLHLLLNMWIKGITGQPPLSWSYWLPALSSMLVWPLCFLGLRELRRHFRLN